MSQGFMTDAELAYATGLGQELARTIRADVERAVLAANVPRVSKNIHSESTTYHAGRRQ